jgi:hypothetical protein
MKSILRRVVCQCVVAMAVAAALASGAFAQDGNIRSVTLYTVKPDRIGDFEAEVKAYNAVLAKGGSTHYASVWLSQTGPREYARVIYYSHWAELDAGPDPKMKDQAADLARINVRIIDCTESWRRIVDEINPDLSLPATSDIPKMIRVLVTDVRPEKIGDYLDLMRNEILPAVKKGGVTSYTFASRRFGAPSTEFISVGGLNSWADLDGGYGAEKGLGKEGYKALLAKVRTLIVQSQYDVYRFDPDLSYLPPPTAK